MMLTASSSRQAGSSLSGVVSSLQAPPLSSSGEVLDCHSSSPTNTSSGSDTGSALSSRFDLSNFLAASNANNLVGKAVDIFQQQISQDSNSMVTATSAPSTAPLFGTAPDPAALLQLSQLFQAQQVIQAAAQQRVQQQMQSTVQHPHQQQERKRSYPCTFQFCVICQKDVHSSKLPCHIRQCHVAKPMFQCPACDFTSTYSKNNVKSHMVSLHGLAGDPISYMDKYASQVEEFMKMCFPNVRGRGRPMQGRTSPKSPISPLAAGSSHARRASQSSAIAINNRRNSMAQDLAVLQQQALLAAQTYNNRMRLNPLSIFPNVFNSSNNSAIMSTQPNSGGSGNRTEEATTAAAHTEMNEAKPATMDEILNRLANKVNPPTRTHSISSSVRSSITQSVRPGENMQPRYLHTQICWSVLNEEQARATVFAELSTIENATEMFDSSLLTSPESPFILLSEDEAAKVASVRDKLKLQLFEVMFAVHSIARMDLTVLGPELVQLVAEIAPTSADEVRMRQFERVANDAPPLGENEQFLLALSKIDRLEEKLFVMQHMANFKQKTESIQESLNVLTEAAKSINSSASLKQLLQWILVLMNYFIGDKTGKSIRGFRTSQINEICSRTLHNGETILSLLATTINSDLHELKGAIDLLPAVNNASQEMFMELSTAVCRLEEGNILAERELEFASANNAPLTALAEFLEGARTQITQIFESLISSREELASMLLFFGEPVPRAEEPFHPEQFFFNLSSFLTSLQAALQPSESQSQSGKSDSDSTQDSPDSNAEPIRVTSP